MLRQMVIANTITNEKWATQFDSEITKDSEALHILLCYVNPGDNYTVSFTNETEELLPAKCLFQGIERPNADWLSSDN